MDQAALSRTRSRGISFRSDKSSGSKGKVDLTESPEEKSRRDSIWKNSSKANPNAALNELTPGAVAEETPRAVLADLNTNKVLNLTEQSTLQSLREYQHKDVNGNTIVDPDLSNPTRPRMERPLDTIRSFEKAIDNGYKRRASYSASQSYDQNGQFSSRRSSNYYGESMRRSNHSRRSIANAINAGHDGGPSPGRHSAAGGGYYGADRRPDSYHQGPHRQQRYGSRVVSEGATPANHHHHQMGPPRPYGGQHVYHQSGDTVNTANGSDSTSPWANSTDPSSENSSIDKNLAGGGHAQNGGQQNGYGYGNPTIQEDKVAGPYGGGGPVRAPQQGQAEAPRKMIALGNSGDPPVLPTGKLPSNARSESEKKSGWLKRRFSKKG
ncbi:hypothetical protein LTR91_000530 [Friedmanniomyces endolithicus]|uniref:DUF2406 domain-containing protein n=1 Tax=Friedmanniomyces endolithicus TaxID=329885 RepID=A0AAN6L3F8_9PEZI|nr:hypothetical protein LTR35_014897 [Friedmanniomyces endolithicus]KAK1015505.1 hypothetical protein LTR91_000530 [Friedmanniomyces endolithicus]